MTNPNKVGLVIPTLIGVSHLVWVVLVATGWAQPLINFIFWAHMIQPIYVIGPFDPMATTALVVITFCGVTSWDLSAEASGTSFIDRVYCRN